MDISSIRATVAEVMAPLQHLVPMLGRVVTRHYNPYRGGSSHGTRVREFRNELWKATNPRSHESDNIYCMVTSIAVNDVTVKSDDIIAVHILPSSTTEEVAAILEMSLDDLQSVRNGLFLCKGIEESFDQLALSFVPSNVLLPNQYKMVIWKDRYREKLIFKNKGAKIGQYDNFTLNKGELLPFRRALSYQAFLAFDSLSTDDKMRFQSQEPAYFGTPVKSSDLATLYDPQSANIGQPQSLTARTLGALLMTSLKEESPVSDEES